jgi:hypothetical protein
MAVVRIPEQSRTIDGDALVAAFLSTRITRPPRTPALVPA